MSKIRSLYCLLWILFSYIILFVFFFIFFDLNLFFLLFFSILNSLFLNLFFTRIFFQLGNENGLFFFICIFWDWWRHVRWWRFDLFTGFIDEVTIQQVLSVLSASFISNFHRQSELQIKRAHLTQILVLTATVADTRTFVDTSVSFPFEDSEWSETDTALLTVVLLQHTHIWVLAVTLLACNGEVASLPSLFIDVRLY